MNKKEYFRLISIWEQRYGKPKFGAMRYDPATITTACKKCDKAQGKSARHHKANDFFFALWMPNVYAARYIEFRKEDVDRLCDHCHKRVERHSERLKQELYADYNLHHEITVEWCEEWRAKFLALYEAWLKKPDRKRKKKKSHLKAKRQR